MIAYLKGILLDKGADRVTLETGGVGYEVFIPSTTLRRLGEPGESAELFISESIGMYGGGTTLYGFGSVQEKEIFICLRENVPSTGAKKALEHLDKASRSLPDFKRAILEGDARILTELLGFTHKTAQRLIASLKDKLVLEPGEGFSVSSRSGPVAVQGAATQTVQKALDLLTTLGYKPAESRLMLQAVSTELRGRTADIEELIRLALRHRRTHG
ncbi:MAG: Holliday junction branch migration protein RuvA [Elusimicrobia bacterium]|nr:Holliday junction branch migration protein RuvA [Elusimicrobiota bacterium]